MAAQGTTVSRRASRAMTGTAGRVVPGVASVACVLTALELAVRSGIFDERWFPPPTRIFGELARQVPTSAFRTATVETFQSWGTGLVVALLLSVPLGIAIGSSARLYRAVKLVIEFLRPVPSVALIPLAVVMWGTGEETKFFLIVFATFWPMLLQAIYGVQDVDPVALDTARSFGFGRGGQWLYVTLPSTLPYIATGVRIASAIALLLAVGTELIIGAPGLGQQIGLAQSGGVPARMYAYIVATGLLGMTLNLIVSRCERSLLAWHTSHRVNAT